MITPLIVDVDTGIDDALALLFLAKYRRVNLLGVTCVSGNCPVQTVAWNTLAVLATAECDVPVALGADRPLLESRRHSAFHGADGLGGIRMQGSPRIPKAMHAVELMRRIVEDSADPVTLLALGPLTNVALFVRTYPSLAAKLAGIVFMGGATGVGNATAVAEFNVWHDPEAAAIVLDAPTQVTMYGLDIFNRVEADRADYQGLRGSDDPARELAVNLLTRCESIAADGSRWSVIGDAGAACIAAAPYLASVESRSVTVVLAPGAARGQTIVDRRLLPGEGEQHGRPVTSPRVQFVRDVDSAAITRLFLDTLR